MIKLLRSTSFRMALLFIGLFAISSIVIMGWLSSYAEDYILSDTDQTIQYEIETIKTLYQSQGMEALQTHIDNLSHNPQAGIYFLVDGAGQKRAGNLDFLPPLISSRPSDKGEGQIEFLFENPQDKTHPLRLYGHQLYLENGEMILVARNMAPYDALLQRGRIVFILSGGGAILLAFLGGLIMARNNMQHVIRLGENLQKARIDGKARLPLRHRHDEFDNLSEQVNDLLHHIEKLVTTMREMSENIAHDFRKPLNHLRVELETVLLSDKIDREKLEQALSEIDAINRDFDTMLLLSRLDSQSIDIPLSLQAIHLIIAEIADFYTPQIEEAGMSLACVIEDAVQINCHADLLKRALVNLLENALTHGAREGGTITISLQQLEDAVELSIADQGQGVAEPDFEYIQQRYTRLDHARTKAGNGIGLSLVGAIGEAHGGYLRLAENTPSGLIVTIGLPKG